MKKTLSLFFILAISVLLIACEPPSIGEEATIEPAISLSSATLNLNVGESSPLGVTVQGFAASQLRYVSEDTSIATVNAAGIVTAITPGATVVAASYEGLSETVVVFVLPEVEVLQVEVVDVQLNEDNEIVLIYSDGTVENTGVQGVVESAEPVSITSTVVNAQGNLIITLSDGTTYNAGRVVGPAGASGSGGTGPQGPTGPKGDPGDPGDFDTDDLIDLIDREFLLTQLGINSDTWDVISSITLNQWSGLRSLDISQEGFRTLLGITQDQLNALIGLDGLISYNRYLKLYPGYDQPEDVWFKELNDGTLRINVEFDLTSSLGEIYYAAGTENSGMASLDYIFFDTQDGSFNSLDSGLQNAYFTSGTIYTGRDFDILHSSRVRELNVVKYAGADTRTAALLERIPGAFLNTGSVSTLKGALLNPSSNPDHASGVLVFNSNNVFNHYHHIHRFRDWIVTSGATDNLGIFALDNVEIKARFEPIPLSSISTNSTVNYLSTSGIGAFLSGLGITSTVNNSGLFDGGILVDWYDKPYEDSNYFFDYFIPLYTIDSPIYPTNSIPKVSNENFRDPSVWQYNSQEQFWNPGQRTAGDRNLQVSDFIDNIQYVRDPNDQEYTANIRGNTLREWDLFYVVTDSGLAFVSKGILDSNGFAASSGITSGLGYVQFTNPIQYQGVVNSSGFVFDTTSTTPISTPGTWTFMGVTYSGVTGGTYTFNPLSQSTDQNRSASVASTSTAGTTVEEGGLLFIRQQVSQDPFNISNLNLNQGFVYQKDTTAPIVEPIALVSTNPLRTVAKAGDQIDIIIRANEPVKYDYNNTSINTGIFKSSGIGAGAQNVVFQSGITSNNPRPTDRDNNVTVDGSYGTYLATSIRPTVSPADSEGFFNFTGLEIVDRTGDVLNTTTIGSNDFEGYQVWIDPVAPAITTSGFNSTTFLYSGVEVISGTQALSSSGVGSIEVYVVSGVLDYNFTIQETFNQITSGLVDYNITLRSSDIASTSGLIAGITTSESALDLAAKNATIYSGVSVSSGFNDVIGSIDTSSIGNGLYRLRVEMTDYAGNIGIKDYYIYVANPLQLINLTIHDHSTQTLSLNFSNTIVTSGTFGVSDLTLSIFRSSGNSTISTQNLTIVNLSQLNADNQTSLLVRVNTSGPSDQFFFLPDDEITVTIGDSGVEKLFNTVQNGLLTPAPSSRTLGQWPSAPFVYRLNYPNINEIPFIEDDVPTIADFFFEVGFGNGATEVVELRSVADSGIIQFTSGLTTHGTRIEFLKPNNFSGTTDYQVAVKFDNDEVVILTIKLYDNLQNGIYY